MNEALTVSQLNNYVKMLLDGDPLLSNLVVRGEISNFTNHVRSGHFYFSLKDENARVQAVMFRSDAQRMKFMPENGMKVILWGRISLFRMPKASFPHGTAVCRYPAGAICWVTVT